MTTLVLVVEDTNENQSPWMERLRIFKTHVCSCWIHDDEDVHDTVSCIRYIEREETEPCVFVLLMDASCDIDISLFGQRRVIKVRAGQSEKVWRVLEKHEPPITKSKKT